MKLKLKSVARKAKDQVAAWMGIIEGYPFKRTVFNAQRTHQHPAMMSPSKRRKLRRN
jgi:hypothetical protein